MLGAQWSKKRLVLVSSVLIAAISSGLRSKSKMVKFSTIRSLRTDLGIATTPLWVSLSLPQFDRVPKAEIYLNFPQFDRVPKAEIYLIKPGGDHNGKGSKN